MASCFSQPHPWTTKTFNLTVFCICHVSEGIFLRPPNLNTQNLTHHLLLYKNMHSRPKLCWLMQRIASDYEHNQTGRCRKPVTSQHGKCKCLQALGSVAGRCFIKLGFFSAASICCFRWEKEWSVAACAAWVARAGSSLRIFVGVLRYTCGMRERQPREQAPRGDSEIQDTSWAQAPECTFTSLFFTAASISVRSFLLLSTCSIAWCPGAFGFARARSATCPGGWESASQGGRREMQGA